MVSPKDYYSDLAPRYELDVRRLAPAYDDMVDSLVHLVVSCAPQSIIDIGCGTGSIDARILDAIPQAHLTCIDATLPMVESAQHNLRRFGSRAKVIQLDADRFDVSDPKYDAVISNLVLHNLEPTSKLEVLTRIYHSLKPRGIFIWGDIIRHEDQTIQSMYLEYRKTHARTHGVSESEIETNFHKESCIDSPLTIEQTHAFATNVGFQTSTIVWQHDTFAIAYMKK